MPETLEEIVRAELREPVADVVRRLVVELAREELGRIAASLNGGPGPTAEMVLDGPQDRQEPPRALGEGPRPARPATATRRRCASCGEEKAARGFEQGRRQCRVCRAEAARRRYHARQTRARAAAAQASNGAEADEPG
jgi:hypothetical protein